MKMIRFLESPGGRFLRGGVGLAMIGVGVALQVVSGSAWWALAAVGVLPLGAALFDLCLLAPLFHEPIAPHSPRLV